MDFEFTSVASVSEMFVRMASFLLFDRSSYPRAKRKSSFEGRFKDLFLSEYGLILSGISN